MTKNCLSSSTRFIEYEGSSHWFSIENQPSLYYCRFNKEYYSDDLFAHYQLTLPEQVKGAVVKRRAEFLAGRYCAANALMHQGIANFTLGIGKHRNPLWPQGICGAISHSNDYAVAAINTCPNTIGIGIDIEEHVSLETAERLQSQILYGKEHLLLDGEHKALLFTLAFSTKESFFKAAYPQVQEYFNFDAVSIIDFDLEGKTLKLEISNNLGEGLKKGQLVTGHFHHLSNSQLATLVTLQK